MAEVYVFGTVAVDILLHVPALPRPGGHTGGTLHGWRTGGSAANLACALASAGHYVHLVGSIGDDPIAEALLSDLKQHGVHIRHLVRQPVATPRTLIFIDSTGERAMLSLNPPDQPPPLRLPELPELADADLIYVESYHKYPPTLATQAPSALVAVPPPDDLASTGRAHLVIGSTAQLPTPWTASPYHRAREHFGAQLRWVVLTDGPRGATAHGADQSVTIPARPAQQLDATGAGDAFAAGLLHSLLAGEQIETAMSHGTTWGAAAVERRSSIPPAFHDVFDRP
jgi:sugar/nucleoside kinase (ribokinase family)